MFYVEIFNRKWAIWVSSVFLKSWSLLLICLQHQLLGERYDAVLPVPIRINPYEIVYFFQSLYVVGMLSIYRSLWTFNCLNWMWDFQPIEHACLRNCVDTSWLVRWSDFSVCRGRSIGPVESLGLSCASDCPCDWSVSYFTGVKPMLLSL